jgi:alanyl-tRNA synthetase
MHAAEIRRRFLTFFESRAHQLVPSSSLVPEGDPSLLFTNAGMVQFKRTFLGQDPRPYVRATTCQKCVRAGGKHNDLEQVGLTRRHHTFFEMLGNFSFGDYFKRDAIAFAWEFVTSPEWLGIPADRLRVTVHHTDDEARKLWAELAGLPDHRIYGLDDKDNFWQMGDTGPCGPCTEIFVDMEWRPGDAPVTLGREDFERLAEAGRFLEIWNLVFMQFDRAADGTLTALPRPSVDTGAGLERIAAVLQGKDDNFHTDLFLPLIERVEQLVGRKYPGGPEGEGLSFRVLADHARAATFLIHDGVFPSNEGRGFVLRRIIRRGVRHAWLMGQRGPTLSSLVEVVVPLMSSAYPTLGPKQYEISDLIRGEESRFFETIDAGLSRLDVLFANGVKRIPGDEAFKLFDTFGFPIDLTELIAAEHDVTVDLAGFERAMEEQRQRSRTARSASLAGEVASADDLTDFHHHGGTQHFVGYSELDVTTELLGHSRDGRVLILRDNPFYAAGSGQIGDTGVVRGDGWTFTVSDVMKSPEYGSRLVGTLDGTFHHGPVQASVDRERRRDIERNHSATHLAHMELRKALGPHVRQQGSLVEPGRLRFDFSHHGPIDAAQLTDIEAAVNDLILANAETDIQEMALDDALKLGAMAFFADKYGDRVRVVRIGDSVELCGGTHVRSAGQIGLFRFVSQGGVAAGVRRIEAATGHGAYGSVRALDRRIATLAGTVRAQPDQLERKIESLLAERDKLEARLAEAMKGGNTGASRQFQSGSVNVTVSPTVAEDRAQLGALADEFRNREKKQSILVLVNPTAPASLTVAVTDDLAAAGKDANSLVKLATARYGGRGGGRPTFASGSLAVSSVDTVAGEDFAAMIREWIGA